MTFTGGPLNLLNGKMGISAPHRSVPVMKLIRAHNPLSKQELEELIARHASGICECGIVSQGTVINFGENLYNAQYKFWGEYKYSLKACIQWEYDLFITQSLSGGIMEKKALKELNLLLPYLKFSEAAGYLDEELRIDITVGVEENIRAGLQVKPSTFLRMRDKVITFNHLANKKWGKPVYYLYYDDRKQFTNLKEVAEQLEAQISKES